MTSPADLLTVDEKKPSPRSCRQHHVCPVRGSGCWRNRSANLCRHKFLITRNVHPILSRFEAGH